MKLNRKQIAALQRIHREAYSNSPLMVVTVKENGQVIEVGAREDRDYPDGEYRAEWIVDKHGKVARTKVW